MTSRKSFSQDSLSSKIKRSAKSIQKEKPSAQKKLKESKISVKAKTPELSVVNVIERISKLLRLEVRDLAKKKVVGE